MELLIELLNTANSLSPLAVIALLVTVVLMLVKGHKKVVKIEGNDLHHIDENLRHLADHLGQISETLQRIEVSLTYVKARVNGKSD